tara:strand:+ start:481 stop:825 length:345 start_codon:yes stop_codon:yes gene_type:complete
MENPSKEKILAVSSGWVATTLNFLPGLGAGYLYQRRLVPYFVTVGLVTGWFLLGTLLNGDTEPTKIEQLIGIGGLLLISITTMIEAKIAQKNAVLSVEKELQDYSQKKRSGLFR